MFVNEKQKSGAQGMSLEVVWRDPLPHVRASLRSRQASNPYCRWAEQASKVDSSGDPRWQFQSSTLAKTMC